MESIHFSEWSALKCLVGSRTRELPRCAKRTQILDLGIIPEAKHIIEQIPRSDFCYRCRKLIDSNDDFLPVGAGVLPPHVENVRHAAAMLRPFERVHEGLTDCRKARMGIPHLQPPAGVLGFIDRDLPAPDPLRLPDEMQLHCLVRREISEGSAVVGGHPLIDERPSGIGWRHGEVQSLGPPVRQPPALHRGEV